MADPVPPAPLVTQDNAAAERSAHVTRGSAQAAPLDACCVCGGPWAKGGASYAARCGPPLLQVCSAECMAKPPFAAGKAPLISVSDEGELIASWFVGKSRLTVCSYPDGGLAWVANEDRKFRQDMSGSFEPEAPTA